MCAQPPTLQCGAECSACCVTQRAFVSMTHIKESRLGAPTHRLRRLPAQAYLCVYVCGKCAFSEVEVCEEHVCVFGVCPP